LSLGVVTILHTYRNLAGLRLTALGADPVFAGERAGFRVRLESPRRARQAIAVGWPERPLEYADLAGDAAAASRVARSGGTAAPRQPRRLPGRR
ncbi:DUF58 domain-containing protein, partial [Pseudomonas aeruginosa]